MNNIINTPGMQAVAEVTEQGNKMKAMFDVPQLVATSPLISALNSSSMILARQIAEQNSKITQQIFHPPLTNYGLCKDINFEQDGELPSNECTDKNGKENQETD